MSPKRRRGIGLTIHKSAFSECICGPYPLSTESPVFKQTGSRFQCSSEFCRRVHHWSSHACTHTRKAERTYREHPRVRLTKCDIDRRTVIHVRIRRYASAEESTRENWLCAR